MKKFTVALDGLRFSESALEYALYLAKWCNAHLVGAFLDDFTYHSYSFSEVSKAGENWDSRVRQLDSADEDTRKNSIEKFEVACQQRGINFTVHRDKSIAYQELLHETIYSDLLILSANETFSLFESQGLSGFVKEILADTECPILAVQENFLPPGKIIILYDGDPSSVYAAKMFSYLMLGLHPIPIEVLTVKNEKNDKHLPDNRLMREFMKRHYADVRYTILKGDPETEITSYLRGVEVNTIVVVGAYARSRVSRWFKKSMADHILSNITLPVFIAHNT